MRGVITMSKEKPPYGVGDYCPFMSREYVQCHTTHMTSQAIPKVLKYCAGDYENCEVYKQLTAGVD
jgi:hypothetical protein